MNGARSTFMRKGYWLTALATAVLLAASSGTAWAQVRGDAAHGDDGVEITLSSKVTEGDTATINVVVTGKIAEISTAAQNTVTVTIAAATTQSSKGSATPAEATASNAGGPRDFRLGGETIELEFGTHDDGDTTTGEANALSGLITKRGSIDLDTFYDPDAEDEYVTLTVAVANLSDDDGDDLTDADVVGNLKTTITDVDDQTYSISLSRGDKYEEGTDFSVNIAADPEHVQGKGEFRLRIADQDGGLLKNYDYTALMADKNAAGDIVVGSADGMTIAEDQAIAANSKKVTIDVPGNDKNRVADTVVVELLKGSPGDYTSVDSVEATLDDVHVLPDEAAITMVARDAASNGKEVTEVMEGGDPVYLTLTVNRGTTRDRVTNEKLMVDIKPANSAQVTDYTLSASEVTFEARDSGRQSSTVELKLSALSDEDVGDENLVLNLVLSGVSGNGTSTTVKTVTLAIVDDTTTKVSPKAEAEAYPMIRAALGKDPQTTVMNPGESGTIMMGDLFTVMEGYDASYKVSESGGAVSVTAPDDMVTIAANAVGTSKVTVTATATAEMAASSFLPEQTVSDVASITFEVMVEAAAEPVPALPLIAQWLLGLGLLGGGARQLFRRRRQG